MIAIVDYGMGNIFSIASSLKFLDQEVVVSSDMLIIEKADRILLPGVGAFKDAIHLLRSTSLDKFIIEQVKSGKPLLGICLGMQLLFDKSYEYGVHEGLGLIKGEIVGMEDHLPSYLKIPQIGWNNLDFHAKHEVFEGVKDTDFVYFVHSYFASNCQESLIASTKYGLDITAAVAHKNIVATQFHPEKSGQVGLRILKNFCNWNPKEFA